MPIRHASLALRTASRSIVGRRMSVNTKPAAAASALSFHSSAKVRDSAHGASASHGAEEEEHYPSEGFGPFWRFAFLGLIGGAAYVRYSSSNASDAGHEHAAAQGEVEDEEGEEESSKSFVARYLDYYRPKPADWIAINDRHLDAARRGAEDRLFFQDAERPPIRRLRNASSLLNGSPGHLAVGDGVDMSDVKVKQEGE